jgi:hypothetical protein
VRALAQSVHWFSASEAEVWGAMLEQLHFRRYAAVIGDCLAQRESHANIAPLREFLEELGVEVELDLAEGR